MFATKGQSGGSLGRLETRNGHFRGSFWGLFSPAESPAGERKYALLFFSNQAYIAKKQILKKKNGHGCETVDASWPAIVPAETFHEVQRLLLENEKTRTNQVRKVQHVYVFNHGLVFCGKCQSSMEGRSGTSHKRQRYYYYVAAIRNVLSASLRRRLRR